MKSRSWPWDLATKASLDPSGLKVNRDFMLLIDSNLVDMDPMRSVFSTSPDRAFIM
jgi:hypothetical protein